MIANGMAEKKEQGPVVVGASQPNVSLDAFQVQGVAHRRLQYLSGGVLLSEEAIARLTGRLTVQRFAAGELIVRAGLPADFFAVVSRGQVAIHSMPSQPPDRAMSQGEPSVLLLPGSTFGEAMLIDGRPSGSTVRAATDAEVYVLRRADYLQEARERPPQPSGRGQFPWKWIAIPALALAILMLAAAVAYIASVLINGGFGRRSTDVEPPSSVPVSQDLQIVAPQQGAVVQHSAAIPVRAVLTDPGHYQVDLLVDGVGQEVQLNPDRDVVPWLVEWAWSEASEGSHVLALQAHGTEHGWVASVPVTVTVAPAGTLAFSSNREGPYAIYTMTTDGRNVQRVTGGPGDARQPAWGTDRVLAYVAEPEVSQAQIRQLTVGGAEGQESLVGRDPAWSPASTRLAYAFTVQDVSQVFTVIATGGRPFQVTNEEVHAGQPAWSPDGKYLAYAAEREENWDIWVVPLDGGGPVRLTEDAAIDRAPAWSPDGSQLAFVSDRGGQYQIYVMRVDGSGVRALTEFERGAEAPAWSPDGYWLSFVAYTGEGTGVNAREIYLMRSDGLDQVRLTYNAFDDDQPDWQRVPGEP